MREVSSAEWFVLNATADDAENLERIYRCLAFGYVPGTDLWREIRPSIPLGEVADAIRSLVAAGLLTARWDPAEPSHPNDLSYVWKAWFEMTEAGRTSWEGMAGASLQASRAPSAR